METIQLKTDQVRAVMAGVSAEAIETVTVQINGMVERKLAAHTIYELEKVTVSDFPSQRTEWNVWHLKADVCGRLLHVQMHVKRK